MMISVKPEILLFLMLSPLTLFSQETEAELVLPEMILEINTIQVQDIQALLPPPEGMSLPSLDLPLPEVSSLSVREIELDLESSPSMPSLGSGLSGRSELFLQALLGIGSPNFITADLEILKLGEYPRFRLEFEHFGQDGYWNNGSYTPPGSHHKDSLNRILGEIQLSLDSYAGDYTLEVMKKILGLQFLGPYQTMDWDRYTLGLENQWTLSETWSFQALALADHHSGAFSGPGQPLFQSNDLELVLGPSLEFSWLQFWFFTGFGFSQGRGEGYWDPWDSWSWASKIGFGLSLPADFFFETEAYFSWNGANPFYRAYGELSRKSRDLWSIEGRYAFQMMPLGFFTLWEKDPWYTPGVPIDQSASPSHEAQMKLLIFPHTQWDLYLQGNYSHQSNGPKILAFDPIFGMMNWERGLIESFSLTFGSQFVPLSGWGWMGEFSYSPLPENPHEQWSFLLKGEWTSEKDFWGLETSLDWAIPGLSGAEDFPWPLFDLEAYIRWNDFFLTRLTLEDGLSPFMKEGRKAQIPEIQQPGFRLMLAAQISY